MRNRTLRVLGGIAYATFALIVAAATGCSAGATNDDAPASSEGALQTTCVAQKLARQAESCTAMPPATRPEGFRHKSFEDAPLHRGRDMFFREGEEQWILAKFAYGAVDDKVVDEDVDIYVASSCGSRWEKLDRMRTSGRDHTELNVEGFEDDEGRVLYKIPAAKQLPVGRHRVRLVVAADGSATELYLEVVPRGTDVAVIDIDGTINLGMVVEETYKLFDATSPIRPGVREVLTTLADRGVRPYYLTARADLDIARTRDFIRAHGLPDGVIHTTPMLVGLFSKPAAVFKERALSIQRERGLTFSYAFGNQKSDAEAYEDARIPRARRVFYGFDDDRFGGRRIDAWDTLLPEVSALPRACR